MSRNALEEEDTESLSAAALGIHIQQPAIYNTGVTVAAPKPGVMNYSASALGTSAR